MSIYKKWLVLMLAVMMLGSIALPAANSRSSSDALANTGNQVTVYYKTGFTNANIHYRPIGGQWSALPGLRMLPAEVSGYQKITLLIGSATGIEACFNNGGSAWDSNGMKNYVFPVGVSTYTPGINGSAGVITPGLPYQDSAAPSVPATLKADEVTADTVKLTWGPSTDNLAVAGYEVLRNQTGIGLVNGATFTNTGLQANTQYEFAVRAVDMAGNRSAWSAPLTVKTTEQVNHSVTIYYKHPASWNNTFIHYKPNAGSWTKAPGVQMTAAEVAGYRKLTFTIGNSTTLEAVFNNGATMWDNNNMKNYVFPPGVSRLENGVIRTGAPFVDNTPPITVNKPSLISRTATTATINWPATTDDTAVTGYEVFRNNQFIAAVTGTGTALTDSGLQPATAYSYAVRALDGAGNRSALSESLFVTTASTQLNPYTIYYKIPADWKNKAFIHYRFGTGAWTTVPGTALTLAEDNPAYGVFTAQSAAGTLEAVFNNGTNLWDNNTTRNYLFSPGAYTLAGGKVTAGIPAVPTLVRLQTLPASGFEVEVDTARSLGVEAVYSDGSRIDVTAKAVYVVREPAVATVVQPGLIKGVTQASTTIDITFQGLTVSGPIQVVQTATTKPTSAPVSSLYLSNWKDNLNIWMASKLAQTDKNTIYGPRIAEMRIKEDFATNQIRDYTSYFRNETTKADYTDVAKFNSDAYLDENGALRTKYVNFNGGSMPVAVSKDYVTVPNEDFTVTTLTFKNETDAPIEYNMLEQLRMNNKVPSAAHSAWYDAASQTMYVNMSASGQFYAAITTLQPVASYQIGDSDLYNLSLNHAAPLAHFRANGTLNNNAARTSTQIALGFQDKFIIPARGEIKRSFAVTIEPTLDSARQAITKVRAQTADQWFNRVGETYQQWLTAPGKKQLSFADEGFRLAYQRNLVMIKNSINPVSGAMPATTNPYAYGYKVWARDSAVTAMILDQAGFYEESRKYWYWLNDRMRDNGTVGTCYDLWTNRWVTFVDPEHDSIGFFLLGVYQHYKLTGNKLFLQEMWNKFKRSADFVADSALGNSFGFGAMDHSIWEEFMEYNAFTQAAYVAGLNGAQHVARELGQPALADKYRNAANRINAAIQRSSNTGPGLWNESGQYYNRAVMGNGSIKSLVDASSAALIVYGVVDAMSNRADSHIRKIKSNLQHDGYGVARYDNDDYYFTSIYNPGGDEALSSEPSWPQMSMYVALHHIYRGEKEQALPYMKWMIERMFSGYMAQGEAVSNVSKLPAPSTSPEPVTGAWFLYTALAYEGKADMRVAPPANVSASSMWNRSGKNPVKWPGLLKTVGLSKR